MQLKKLKSIKGSLSRDEMKTILGGAECTSDCGASCSGETCVTTSNGGVKCRTGMQITIGLCPVIITA